MSWRVSNKGVGFSLEYRADKTGLISHLEKARATVTCPGCHRRLKFLDTQEVIFLGRRLPNHNNPDYQEVYQDKWCKATMVLTGAKRPADTYRG